MVVAEEGVYSTCCALCDAEDLCAAFTLRGTSCHLKVSLLPTLPEEWRAYLTSDEFIDSAMDKFDNLDADGNGTLTPDELVPVIVELTSTVALVHDDPLLVAYCREPEEPEPL